ncbi:hypothetical protein BGW39_011383, partial [Mortierella sp. 14UC]
GINDVNTDFNRQQAQKASLRHARALAHPNHLADGCGENEDALSLKEYHSQSPQEKDVILVKDAQVAMLYVLDTMSERTCKHFEMLHENQLVKTAKSLNVINGFEEHECTTITRRYSSILAEKGVDYLRKTPIDRGAIYKEHVDLEQLPASAELEDKALQILVLLTWAGGVRTQIPSNPLQDIGTRSPPSSPTEEMLKRKNFQ